MRSGKETAETGRLFKKKKPYPRTSFFEPKTVEEEAARSIVKGGDIPRDEESTSSKKKGLGRW